MIYVQPLLWSAANFDRAYAPSMLEVLDECLLVEVSPVIDLNLLVEWGQLLLDLILGGSVDELLLGCGDVRGVEDQHDLRFGSSISSGVLELEDAVSTIAIFKSVFIILISDIPADQDCTYLPPSLGRSSLNCSKVLSLAPRCSRTICVLSSLTLRIINLWALFILRATNSVVHSSAT